MGVRGRVQKWLCAVGQKLLSDSLILPASGSSSSEQRQVRVPFQDFLCACRTMGSALCFSHVSVSSRPGAHAVASLSLGPPGAAVQPPGPSLTWECSHLSLWGLRQGRSPREETPPHKATQVELSEGQALCQLGNEAQGGVTLGQSRDTSCFPVHAAQESFSTCLGLRLGGRIQRRPE